MGAADAFRIAANYLLPLQIVVVKQFAADNGLEAMRYDQVTDTWYFTDGEPYTTSAIIKHMTRQ